MLGDIRQGNRSAHVHVITPYDSDGLVVFPDDEGTEPFSTRQTCGACHDYEKISTGRHFNAGRPGIEPGRTGEPWIFWDAKTATQLPLSYRPWPGAFHPSRIDLTKWRFTLTFGRHSPGGGAGEQEPDTTPDPRDRWDLSGNLEINCLSCHSADPAQNQAEYAGQIIRQNFRWATAAGSGMASVRGSVSMFTMTRRVFYAET
jgi:hypothetical protein